jgi:hypothetical protein
MNRNTLISVVFWCLFGLYLYMALLSGKQLLFSSGLFGDPANLDIHVYNDWVKNFLKRSSYAFHFTMASTMVAGSILLYRGKKLAHRVTLVVPWLVFVFSVLMWLVGNFYRLAGGGEFIPDQTPVGAFAVVIGGLLLMFTIALLNSWLLTSEPVLRWLEDAKAPTRSGASSIGE